MEETGRESLERRCSQMYSKLGFLCQVMISLIDELEGTNLYKHKLKKYLNLVFSECDPITKESYNFHKDKGNITHEVKALDIWRISSISYEDLINWIIETPASDILFTMRAVSEAQNKGVTLNDLFNEYEGIK